MLSWMMAQDSNYAATVNPRKGSVTKSYAQSAIYNSKKGAPSSALQHLRYGRRCCCSIQNLESKANGLQKHRAKASRSWSTPSGLNTTHLSSNMTAMGTPVRLPPDGRMPSCSRAAVRCCRSGSSTCSNQSIQININQSKYRNQIGLIKEILLI